MRMKKTAIALFTMLFVAIAATGATPQSAPPITGSGSVITPGTFGPAVTIPGTSSLGSAPASNAGIVNSNPPSIFNNNVSTSPGITGGFNGLSGPGVSPFSTAPSTLLPGSLTGASGAGGGSGGGGAPPAGSCADYVFGVIC
jgi:hypothetical protein